MTLLPTRLIALVLAASFAIGCHTADAIETPEGERWLSHDVYFDLTEGSPENCARLEADCWDMLSDLPGIRFFATGTIATELAGEVNDQGFDVALHVVFETMADHDLYQTSESHQEFLRRHGDTWAGVRVFDAWIEARAPYQGF